MAQLYKRYRKNGAYTWYVNYSLQGKFKMRSTGTSDKKLAEQVRRKIEEEVIRARCGLPPLEEIQPILLSEFIDIYLEEREKSGKASKTLDVDERALCGLIDYIRDCNLTSITEAVARKYREVKLKTLKSTSVSIELRALRAAFNWCIEKHGVKYLYRNPFAQKRLIPPPEPVKLHQNLSPDEKSRFLAAIDNPEHEKLFKFFLLTGCRWGEALNLQWIDLDLEQRKINFRITKTKKIRSIPINLELMQVVLALDRSKPKPFNYHPNTVTRQFKRYLQKTGIRRDFHLHNLRHTAASDLVREGVHLTKI